MHLGNIFFRKIFLLISVDRSVNYIKTMLQSNCKVRAESYLILKST